VFLLETLNVKFSGLVYDLYSEHVISAVERDDICAEKTSFRANEKLLSVLSRKSHQQFQLFLNALDNCGQRHVSNVITGQRPGLLTIIQDNCNTLCISAGIFSFVASTKLVDGLITFAMYYHCLKLKVKKQDHKITSVAKSPWLGNGW